MSAYDFRLERDIEVASSVLYDFLCDLNNYVSLHPFIESIERLTPSVERPRAKRYRVVDRIPLGPFNLRITYIAALDAISENEVHGYAWQFPLIRLHTVSMLTATSFGTHLVESVTIKAPPLIRRFVVNQARQAHTETLSKLKTLLETTSQPSIPARSRPMQS